MGKQKIFVISVGRSDYDRYYPILDALHKRKKVSLNLVVTESHSNPLYGKTLSFIDESNQGDLAFFNDDEGKIVHVGILLNNNNIIHAHGKVRIDRIDQTGIFNSDEKKHSHKLRFIKKII